ncbi:hypothetical protein H2241_16165 [Pantoea ananatis]|uniref:hypothetical protein n=1 Tax=Pantoea ananas TaxID=553 RepID=UPI00158B4E09|nr:hypothetical protein [Pantoea ananatis]MBA4822486.1 hypothetical protein [Pantoea ananatis]QKV87667.1 hypothetical protein FOB88_11260 [Pantoea ananatis]
MISDERIDELASDNVICVVSWDERIAMAREIQAYRKAFNNPVAWEVKGVYCGSYSEAKSMFPQRMPYPLFEKPTIPE